MLECGGDDDGTYTFSLSSFYIFGKNLRDLFFFINIYGVSERRRKIFLFSLPENTRTHALFLRFHSLYMGVCVLIINKYAVFIYKHFVYINITKLTATSKRAADTTVPPW